MSISIVIPAYQEAQNLSELLPVLKKTLIEIKQPFEILVVDAITKIDNTDEICRINDCIYINREHGNKYGDAIRTGIANVHHKYTVIMDADGSHNPDDIIRFCEEMKKGYDLIIGSRYTSGGDSHNNVILKLMSYILNTTYRILFKINAKDISNSFRMYKTEQIKSLSLECDDFDIVQEILIKLLKYIPKFVFCEIPVYFDKRKYGKSKRNLAKFIVSYVTTIKKLMVLKKK